MAKIKYVYACVLFVYTRIYGEYSKCIKMLTFVNLDMKQLGILYTIATLKVKIVSKTKYYNVVVFLVNK